MREQGRADSSLRLLSALLISLTTAAAHAQVQHIDFQVIHLPRIGGSEVHFLAVRSQDEWLKFWRRGSVEPTLSGTPQPATALWPPPPKVDFTRYILLVASTGVKPSSGHSDVFISVDAIPASMTGPVTSKKDVTTVHILELEPGNCPAFAHLADSVSYALIPQTANEIRFIVSNADSDCNTPVTPPFIK
jgi:hypothetical protein